MGFRNRLASITMSDLQHHMDEQQEKHERLMAGRDPEAGDLMCGIPVDLSPSKPLPAHQNDFGGSGDTKTPLEEIDALKAKVRALEEAVRAITPNRLGPSWIC